MNLLLFNLICFFLYLCLSFFQTIYKEKEKNHVLLLFDTGFSHLLPYYCIFISDIRIKKLDYYLGTKLILEFLKAEFLLQEIQDSKTKTNQGTKD